MADAQKFDVFLVCVLLNPIIKRDDDGEPTRPDFVVQPTWVIAKTEDEAKLVATTKIPQDHAAKTTRLEVRVLYPFRR